MRPSTVSASSTRSSARSCPILKIPTRGTPLRPVTVGMGTCEYSKQSFGTCVTLIVCSHSSCCCVILSGSTGYFACKYGQQSFGTCVTLFSSASAGKACGQSARAPHCMAADCIGAGNSSAVAGTACVGVYDLLWIPTTQCSPGETHLPDTEINRV